MVVLRRECLLSDDPDPGRAFSSFQERLGREGAKKRDLDDVTLNLWASEVVPAVREANAGR